MRARILLPLACVLSALVLVLAWRIFWFAPDDTANAARPAAAADTIAPGALESSGTAIAYAPAALPFYTPSPATPATPPPYGGALLPPDFR